MMAQLVNHHNNHTALPQIVETYVFETPAILPQGFWTLTIEEGDAWVFCNRGDFPLHAGKSATFEPCDGLITIRRLYVRGKVKFRAQQHA